MQLYYSSLKNGFFCEELHGPKQPDWVEITPELHQELLTKQGLGYTIGPDKKGKPQATKIKADK